MSQIFLVVTDRSYQNHRYLVQYNPCYFTVTYINSPPWGLFAVLVMISHCTFIAKVID